MHGFLAGENEIWVLAIGGAVWLVVTSTIKERIVGDNCAWTKTPHDLAFGEARYAKGEIIRAVR